MAIVPARDEAKLIRGIPGLFGKAGAEGVYAVALDDGHAVALKIADGQPRARPVVMAAVYPVAGTALVALAAPLLPRALAPSPAT